MEWNTNDEEATAESVHALGLREVERIEKEMERVQRMVTGQDQASPLQTHHGDRGGRGEDLGFLSAEEMMLETRILMQSVSEKLPYYFNHLFR